ncbi:MAG: hypothetical protein ACI4VQ_07150 [Clostridia bacterium]
MSKDNYRIKKKNKKIENNQEEEYHLEELINGEETTKYGEFISSYFAWLGLNKQKTRAEELNDMTKE